MALSILITQCLQRDFVDPVRRHDTLPNRLIEDRGAWH